MKKLAAIWGLTFATMGLSGVAWAGFRTTEPVQVGSSWASGSLGSTRNTADNVASIGCQLVGTSAGSNLLLCSARTSAGVSASCSATAPALISAAQSIGTDSLLYFQWDSSARCTYLMVTTSSSGEPKRP